MKKIIPIAWVLLLAFKAGIAPAQHAFSDIVTFPTVYTSSNPLTVSSCNVVRTNIYYNDINTLDHNLSLGYVHEGGNSTNGIATFVYVYDVYKYDCGNTQTLNPPPPVLFRSDVEESVVVKKHMSVAGWTDPISSLINLHVPDMKNNYPTGLYEMRIKKIRLELEDCSSIPYRFSYRMGTGGVTYIDNNQVGSGTSSTYTSHCVPNILNTASGCDWKEFVDGTQPSIFFKYVQTNAYYISSSGQNRYCVNKVNSSLGANCTPTSYTWKFYRTIGGVTEVVTATGQCAQKPCGKWNYEVSVTSTCYDCTGQSSINACPFKLAGSYQYFCAEPVDTIKAPDDPKGGSGVGKIVTPQLSLTVMPNPASGSTVTIKIPAEANATGIQVYDNARNIRFRQPIRGSKQVTLNIDSWKAGVYHCAVTLDDGTVLNTSIIRH